jgi:hypothetical protein
VAHFDVSHDGVTEIQTATMDNAEYLSGKAAKLLGTASYGVC